MRYIPYKPPTTKIAGDEYEIMSTERSILIQRRMELGIGISFVVVMFYYYILNHPRFCKWWSWLITLGVNSLIALFVGYGVVVNKYVNGYIHDSLMFQRDEDGNILAVLIGDGHCWGFGVANIFVAMIFFVVLSFLLKWWSGNAKHVPF